MDTFEILKNKLNSAQRQAVETLEGPVMVVAGPGTGKTQILALRIANILKQTDAGPENILCLTFTEAGVKAMRERLIGFIGNAAYRVSIHTFHSFANEVIQSFPEKFAFSKELIHLDDLKRLKIMREIIDQDESLKKLKPFHDKYSKVRDIISAIQTLKKESITSEELKIRTNRLKVHHEENKQLRGGKPTKKWIEKFEVFEMLNELASIYKSYQVKLQNEGYYDYEDMIMFVINKFKEDDSLLGFFQEKYLYMLVDEYQDTNGSQNEIIKLLGSFDPNPNIFVVGDDDQAIYRFQGANLGNILFFGKHFTEVAMIPATENYRSTQTILDIASSLIEKNTARLVNEYKDLEKKLKAFKPDNGLKGEVWEFNNNTEENIFVAKEIEKLHESGVKYEEIAVLYRKNAHVVDINEVLNKLNIPTKLDTTKSVFENILILQFIDLLKVVNLYDKSLNELLYKVLLYNFLDFNVSDVYRLFNYAFRNKKNIIDILDDVSALTDAKVNDREKFIEFKQNLLGWHKLNANLPYPEFISKLLLESKILDYASNDKKSENDDTDKRFENILSLNTFVDFIKQQYAIDREINLAKFLTDLNLISENNIQVTLPKSNTNKDAVNLLTAHSSKGLEFEYVFIIKATDNNWGKGRGSSALLPKEIYTDINDDETDYKIEDERRLFFVAITRAKEKVYFTYANEYINEGQSSNATITRFISEIKPDLLVLKSVKSKDIDFKLEDYIQILKPALKDTYKDEEREFLMEQVKNYKLTPSGLNQYLRSPEEFKVNQLIRIPTAKSKEQVMGSAIHFAFERLNTDGRKGSFESVESFLKDYEDYLSKEFFYDEEYERTLEEGKNILSKYYETYIATGVYQMSCEVEYDFGKHNILLETLDGSNPIILSGRIDKIEYIDEELGYVRVTDYKTSRPESENSIKGLTKTSSGDSWRQLVFYKLMSALDKNFKPFGKSSSYEIKEGKIDFLREDAKTKQLKNVCFEFTNDDMDKLKDLIREVMKKIRNLEFPEISEINFRDYQ